MSSEIIPDTYAEYVIADSEKRKKELLSMEKCKICGKPVETMAQKGTGLCGDLCRKRDTGELPLNEIDSNLMPGMKAEGIDPRGII